MSLHPPSRAGSARRVLPGRQHPPRGLQTKIGAGLGRCQPPGEAQTLLALSQAGGALGTGEGMYLGLHLGEARRVCLGLLAPAVS